MLHKNEFEGFRWGNGRVMEVSEAQKQRAQQMLADAAVASIPGVLMNCIFPALQHVYKYTSRSPGCRYGLHFGATCQQWNFVILAGQDVLVESITPELSQHASRIADFLSPGVLDSEQMISSDDIQVLFSDLQAAQGDFIGDIVRIKKVDRWGPALNAQVCLADA